MEPIWIVSPRLLQQANIAIGTTIRHNRTQHMESLDHIAMVIGHGGHGRRTEAHRKSRSPTGYALSFGQIAVSVVPPHCLIVLLYSPPKDNHHSNSHSSDPRLSSLLSLSGGLTAHWIAQIGYRYFISLTWDIHLYKTCIYNFVDFTIAQRRVVGSNMTAF
jgi:hypothetical protein